MQPENFTSQVQDEIEWARALTAIVLAVKLEFAEQRATTVYQSVATGSPTTTD